jgi:hypothetical protein
LAEVAALIVQGTAERESESERERERERWLKQKLFPFL